MSEMAEGETGMLKINHLEMLLRDVNNMRNRLAMTADDHPARSSHTAQGLHVRDCHA